MEKEPIKISWDDLKSENVEGRLREQATVKSTKDHYERANVVAPKIQEVRGLRAFLLQAVVYLCLAGVLGGGLGWAAGELLNVRADRFEEAQQWISDLDGINRAQAIGKYTAEDADRARARLYRIGSGNAYFIEHVVTKVDPKIYGDVSEKQLAARSADQTGEFRADLLLFGVSGLFIAIALASADRLIERDWRGAGIDAGIGAVCGVLGGVVVAFAISQIESRLLGDDRTASLINRMLTRAACWALLGGFLAAAPGIAMRSRKRLLIGIAGGVAGGLLGGLLFDPVSHALGNASLSRLIGLVVIGGAAGLAIGWIENASKEGWLRVAAGLIAGKQFVLYRNPTFIGSAPMSHIYLFRDPQVGRRHAAIFKVAGGGYEIEDLPLGGQTIVNGQPVRRQRLRGGDRITVGRTTLVFEERAPS